MKTFYVEDNFDAIVCGAGHAGVEAALALARLGKKTALLTLNPDSISFMACNPSIGGTAKGHLVREIDALGGEMGVNIDKTTLQIRMLNRGKGAAVQSLRAQADKARYHQNMKKTLDKPRRVWYNGSTSVQKAFLLCPAPPPRDGYTALLGGRYTYPTRQATG